MDHQLSEKSSTSVDEPAKARSTTPYYDDDPMRRGDVEQALEALQTAPMERVPTYLQPRLPFRERLHHFTFAWYTLS